MSELNNFSPRSRSFPVLPPPFLRPKSEHAYKRNDILFSFTNPLKNNEHTGRVRRYYGKMDENSTDLNSLSATLLVEDDLCDLEQTEVRGKIVISAVPLTRMQCSVDDVYSRLDISGAAAFVYAPSLHPAPPT